MLSTQDIEADGRKKITDKLDELESEVSYYTVDNETGEVLKKMVKKSQLKIQLDKNDKHPDLAKKVDKLVDPDQDVEMIEKFDIEDADNQGLQIKQIEGKIVTPFDDKRSKRTGDGEAD